MTLRIVSLKGDLLTVRGFPRWARAVAFTDMFYVRGVHPLNPITQACAEHLDAAFCVRTSARSNWRGRATFLMYPDPLPVGPYANVSRLPRAGDELYFRDLASGREIPWRDPGKA